MRKSDEKYLIVANGYFLPRSIILELAKQRKIIALDGAADRLALLGILPQVILGDFDSVKKNNVWGIHDTFDKIDQNSPAYSAKYGTKIIPAKDQNYTDLDKAIRYCDQHGATQIDIVCAFGIDRLDHSLGNSRILRAQYKPGRPIFLHGEMQSLSFCKNETIVIHGEPDEHCGILAFPEAVFTSRGLKYNGENFTLKFAFSESTCNQLSDKIATITVRGEALIAHPPMTTAHRLFSKKTHCERMEILLREQNRELIEVQVKDINKFITTTYEKNLFYSDFIYCINYSKDEILNGTLPLNEWILISKPTQNVRINSFFNNSKKQNEDEKSTPQFISKL